MKHGEDMVAFNQKLMDGEFDQLIGPMASAKLSSLAMIKSLMTGKKDSKKEKTQKPRKNKYVKQRARSFYILIL